MHLPRESSTINDEIMAVGLSVDLSLFSHFVLPQHVVCAMMQLHDDINYDRVLSDEMVVQWVRGANGGRFHYILHQLVRWHMIMFD